MTRKVLPLFLLCLAWPTVAVHGQTTMLIVRETSMGTLQAGYVPGSLVTSPDATRFAYVLEVNGGYRVVLDGKEEPRFTYVFPKTLRFSPDGKRFGYSVGLTTDRKPPTAAVIDGQRGPVFDEFRPDEYGHNIHFSPDGKHVAYVGERGGKSIPVIDGKEGQAHDGISSTVGVLWCPDSRRWGCAVMNPKSKKGFVVIDGVAGKAFDEIIVPVATNAAASELTSYFSEQAIAFSADGARVAYAAQDGPHQILFVDGKEVARQEAKRTVKKGPNGEMLEFSEGGISNYQFSPKSDRLAFVVSQGLEKQWVVVDGKAQKPYPLIAANARFSADGKHFAYLASPRSGKLVVVRDGVEGKEYDAPPNDQSYENDLIFSPDGSRLATRLHRDGKALVSIDGKDGDPFDDVQRPLFSPDGKRFCHTAVKGQGAFVMVVDGKAGQVYEDYVLPGPMFSHDSKHITYNAARDKKWRVVVDGVETGETYDGFRVAARFVGPNQVRTIAIRGPELVRLDIEMATEEAVLAKASVNGKYSKFLKKIEVPQDKASYGAFFDYGSYCSKSYAGYNDLPAGYWVYVYPHWYIWGEAKGATKPGQWTK